MNNFDFKKELTQCHFGDTAVKFINCKHYLKCLDYSKDGLFINWSCEKCSIFKKLKHIIGIERFNELKDIIWIEFFISNTT